MPQDFTGIFLENFQTQDLKLPGSVYYCELTVHVFSSDNK